ncbi:hypothetical protein RU639_009461 [Aspergillus parasiticus]
MDTTVFNTNTQQILVEAVPKRSEARNAHRGLGTHSDTVYNASTMPAAYHNSEPTSALSLGIIEAIRVAGAVRFGLAQDTATAGRIMSTPKIALLYPCRHEIDVGRRIDETDIGVLPFSLGQPHPSLQLTGAVCVGTALSIPGTVAWDVQRQAPSVHHGASQERQAMMINPTMSTLEMHENRETAVESVSVFRTARRLFEGKLFYRL